jgi:hypothetical protein
MLRRVERGGTSAIADADSGGKTAGILRLELRQSPETLSNTPPPTGLRALVKKTIFHANLPVFMLDLMLDFQTRSEQTHDTNSLKIWSRHAWACVVDATCFP